MFSKINNLPDLKRWNSILTITTLLFGSCVVFFGYQNSALRKDIALNCEGIKANIECISANNSYTKSVEDAYHALNLQIFERNEEFSVALARIETKLYIFDSN